MDTNQRFSFMVIGIGLLFIGGIIWWSTWGTSRWFPSGFRDEQAETPGNRTIQERLLSEKASPERALISTEEREAIVQQLTGSSGGRRASSDQQAIIHALAPSE